jgi:hypothetical protein
LNGGQHHDEEHPVTLLSPPGWLQAGTYTALLDRIYSGTIPGVRDFALAHGARKGFLPSRVPAFSVVSGMTVAVGPCAGIISNTFVTDGGDYKFANPTNFQVVLAGSSPTLNRHDIIGIQVKDNFYDSSGLNQAAPAVIQGTNSAGTPSDPAMPASFIPVCRAVVGAAATSPTLQSMVVRTTHDGGLLPVASDTERTALGTPYSGFPILRTDKFGAIEMWNGSSWVTEANVPYAYIRQTVAQSIPNATFTSVTMNFEDLDNFAGHTTTSRYTIPVDGVYWHAGGAGFASNATGSRQCRWALNGGSMSSSYGPGFDPSVTSIAIARTMMQRYVAGDYIELQVYQSSGGALNTNVVGESQASATFVRVAP